MSDRRKIPTVIERPLPNGVIYDLSTPGHVRITLPPSSTWSSGLHWHETHDEYLQVVQGSIRVRLGDTWSTVTATDDHQPVVKVARFVWHEWKRASPGDGDVEVVERTDPADDEKAIFFWNLNGTILDDAPRLLADKSSFVSRLPAAYQKPALDFWVALKLFVIFAYLDNFPVLVDLARLFPAAQGSGALRRVDAAITHLVLYLACWLGWVLGAKPVRKAHTPLETYRVWWRKRRGEMHSKSM